MYLIFMWLVDLFCGGIGVTFLIIGAIAISVNWRVYSNTARLAIWLPSVPVAAIAGGGLGWWLSFKDIAGTLPINGPVLVFFCLFGGAGIVTYVAQTPARERGAVIISTSLLLLGGIFIAATGWNILFTQHVVNAVCDPHPANCG